MLTRCLWSEYAVLAQLSWSACRPLTVREFADEVDHSSNSAHLHSIAIPRSPTRAGTGHALTDCVGTKMKARKFGSDMDD